MKDKGLLYLVDGQEERKKELKIKRSYIFLEEIEFQPSCWGLQVTRLSVFYLG